MNAFRLGLSVLFLLGNTSSFASPVHGDVPGDYEAGIEAFEDYRAEKAITVSHARHLPRLWATGKRTSYSVLVMHGLFESPHYMKGIAESFAKTGVNVVSILLPGHWALPLDSIDTIAHHEYLSEMRKGLDIARRLGDRVLVAGFSFGGLLAVHAALEYPELVAGLFLWAPALRLDPWALVATRFGNWIGASGNDFTEPAADGYDVPYYSGAAGYQLHLASQELLLSYGGASRYSIGFANEWIVRKAVYSRITVPVFLVTAEKDNAVSVDEQDFFYKQLLVPKKQIRFRKADGISHQTIAKSQSDAFKRGTYNRRFFDVIGQMYEFLVIQFGFAF